MGNYAKDTFVYYDLNTTDPKGAGAFYTKLFGWTIKQHDEGGGHVYNELNNRGQAFGGMQTPHGGAPSHWMGYVEVEGLDNRFSKLEKLGGKGLAKPFDIPNVGRIAVLSDPAGAVFALYESEKSHGDWAPSREKTGDIGWAEIATSDVEKAKGFYGEGFGWTVGRSMDTPNGQYHMLMKGEQPVGGLYQKPPMMPVSAWLYYINVDDADATAAKAKELGANVMLVETVPDMVRFGLMQDPQGAVIGFAHSLG